MIACTLLSGALAAAHVVPVQHISSARQFGKVTVLALVFCLAVVLGNISLKYIPVSFNQVRFSTPSGLSDFVTSEYHRPVALIGNVSIPADFTQAIGATTPLFTAALAFVMLGQTEPRRVYLTLIPVVAGVVLATGDAISMCSCNMWLQNKDVQRCTAAATHRSQQKLWTMFKHVLPLPRRR